MNVIDAAYNVVHDYPGGADSLGPRVGKNSTTLSHEVARVGTAKFGLETAIKVSVMTGDMRILDAFAMQCGRTTLPLPSAAAQAQGGCIIERLGELLRESSDVVREVTASWSDGCISKNEMLRVERECGLLVRSVGVLLSAVRVQHEASQQGGGL